MREIVIDISDTGEVRIETVGFKGKACLEEAKFLKELLGQETLQQLVTAYYTKNKVTVKQYLPLCG